MVWQCCTDLAVTRTKQIRYQEITYGANTDSYWPRSSLVSLLFYHFFEVQFVTHIQLFTPYLKYFNAYSVSSMRWIRYCPLLFFRGNRRRHRHMSSCSNEGTSRAPVVLSLAFPLWPPNRIQLCIDSAYLVGGRRDVTEWEAGLRNQKVEMLGDFSWSDHRVAINFFEIQFPYYSLWVNTSCLPHWFFRKNSRYNIHESTA